MCDVCEATDKPTMKLPDFTTVCGTVVHNGLRYFTFRNTKTQEIELWQLVVGKQELKLLPPAQQHYPVNTITGEA